MRMQARLGAAAAESCAELQDWSDRSAGICPALPTRQPGEPQSAAVPQRDALRSRVCAPVLQSYSIAADTAMAVASNSFLDECANRLAVSANFVWRSLVVFANFIWSSQVRFDDASCELWEVECASFFPSSNPF